MMARTTSGLVTVHDNPASFTCSQCGAHYKVVRVKAQTQSLDHLLRCKVCKQPARRDGWRRYPEVLPHKPARQETASGLASLGGQDSCPLCIRFRGEADTMTVRL